MPTNAASCATAPRMRSASAASAASASGSPVVFIEVSLQDYLGRDRVARGAVAPRTAPRGRNARLRLVGRVALVDEAHRHAEATLEPAREAARPCGHLVLGAVGMDGQSDDEALRLPLGNERRDRVEPRIAALVVDR